MKPFVGSLIFCAATAAGLVGQTSGKGATPTPVSAPGAEPSRENQELNIKAYIQLLRADLNKTRSQIIGKVMQLDATDAAAFWPIYKNFEGDLNKIGDQVVALISDYAANYNNMNDEHADRLATKLLDIEQQRNHLKRVYYQRFKTALNAVTAAEFLQVENQIEKLVDLQIASQLPVVGK
jgi:hypothetical protein